MEARGTANALALILAEGRQLLAPPPEMPIWQWAAEHVDFSRVPNYDTPIHGPFDPNWMPFWKEPNEWLGRRDIDEVVIKKCTRAGGTEHMLLNPMRHAVAVQPRPTLYVTSDQLSGERFMERRIKRGMKTTKATARALRHSRSTQHDISFPAMDLQMTWPRAKMAFKQDGWALVLLDECSTYQTEALPMARNRATSYPFSKVVAISSPDPNQKRPSDEDPIFMAYDRGNQCVWRCPDPAGGWFTFEFGTAGGAGLQWDPAAKKENGEWDKEMVKATAHYITPGGARIDESDRMKIVRAGHWEATNPNGVPGVYSAHVTCFMTPWEAFSFGNVAVDFLTAKAEGTKAMRTFKYEYLAEPFLESFEAVNDDALFARALPYALGTSAAPVLFAEGEAVPVRYVFVTVDVQKETLWMVAREWFEGKPAKSALLGFGHVIDWSEVEAFANHHGAVRVCVDYGYDERLSEVLVYAQQFKAIPLKGQYPLSTPIREVMQNPYEGKRGGEESERVISYLWNSENFRAMLFDMMQARTDSIWSIPQDAPMEYVLQANSTEKKNGKWVTKSGRGKDHLFDCEVMQVVMAYLARLI